jgi:YidC/Oxa1 family membrane protein insertase
MSGNPRMFLWIALAFLLLLNYQAWVTDNAPQATAAASQQAAQSGDEAREALSRSIPKAATATPAAGDSPSSAPQSGLPSAASSAPSAAAPTAAAPASGSTERIRVRTDVLDVDIGLEGGTIERADLLRYPKVKGKTEPVRLMNTDSPQTLYLLQTGLMAPTADAVRPTHFSELTSPKREYDLGDAAELHVPLRWTDGNGVEVTKTFTFRRGEYRIDLDYDVQNRSNEPWTAAAYAQITRNDPKIERSLITTDVSNYAFHGPAIWDGAKYRKLDIEDTDKLDEEVKNGWLAALQHHFVGAIVPPADETYRLTLTAAGREYVAAAAGSYKTIAAGADDKFHQTLFVGPKLQAQLEKVGPRLELVADYGKLTLLAKPLFWLLEKVHTWLGNWGWAIVVVTFLLKLLFYPLSETSGKSMAKMKNLAPRIKNLQEQYKGDREKQGKAMMELYQREKVNPVAGCLPMIVQIPVFLAFYWVLLESVEMRQAPFMLWINDLSSQDPFYILPLIMAVAMFISFKLQPTPADPVQAKVFMVMPLVMSVMFAFFPAGLVLYWVTNTILQIAQQWNINRRIERDAKKT